TLLAFASSISPCSSAKRGAAEQTEEHVMNETERGSSTIFSLHGVRYQATDVARAAAFYTDHLGFRLEHQQLPAFASVLLGDFRLLLSGPGATQDRKSTRLNSSHVKISYAVFCLKKKKKQTQNNNVTTKQ